MTRVSGYGQTGPASQRPGFDRIGLAFGGLTYVTGYPEQPPVRPGYMLGDYNTGMMAAFGTLVALTSARATGVGQDVDIALYESIWRSSGQLASQFGKGRARERTGNYFAGVVPAEQFTTRDNEFAVINATTAPAFTALCGAMGQPELVDDPRFSPRRELMENHEEIHGIVRDWVATLTYKELQAALDEAGVPCTKAMSITDIMEDEHYWAREQIISVETASDHGEILMPGVVPRLSKTPGHVSRAPTKGEHNEQIYRELLGFDAAKVAQLTRDGIL